MKASDVEALDRLLSDQLVFVNHLGGKMTKAIDLEAHRTGFVKIESLEASEREIQVFGDIAIVTVQLAISGRINEQASSGTFRFTRIWQKTGENWQVIHGQSTAIAQPPVEA